MAKLNGPIYLIKDDDLLKKMWEKVFKNEPSKFCGKQPLKNWKAEHLSSTFLKAVFHKFLLGPFLNTYSNIMIFGIKLVIVLKKNLITSPSAIEIFWKPL